MVCFKDVETGHGNGDLGLLDDLSQLLYRFDTKTVKGSLYGIGSCGAAG